ncbi:hypothetical protein IMG5_001570 [Ichthyophthirius multifiliis]|uniref:Guanylate cyclase domain-containing protein n=1 Tax=Ichthyophthirius multifiliis TaxID=5932 RepID=G0QIZ6_ICHMU|nr:hypothetical protein IMG5_001570 [Ichthyophthirius multifiliis]EGR34816.1 hypothetical protein IMG5_001570 [Ichthyophthirius multifiliis]|eukprot:XP_004040120.1 hypothetical protein IMG5_001570 [Ichthyophthirius multifiliis]
MLKLDSMLEHHVTLIIMAIITLYALFGDDIRVLVTDKNGDKIFWILNIICMCVFFIEIILACFAKPDYFNSFFFYLDLISTVSLIFDIGWISDSIYNTQDSNPDLSSSGQGSRNPSQIAQAGKTSRVGTKASRIVRIVRLIRLVKLYKHAQTALKQQENHLKQLEEEQKLEEQNQQSKMKETQQAFQQNHKNSGEEQQLNSNNDRKIKKNENTEKNIKSNQEIQNRKILKKISKISQQQKAETPQIVVNETKLGKQLSNLTTQRVIILVLSIMISVPVFTLETYREPTTSYNNTMPNIYTQVKDSLILENFNKYINFHKDTRTPILYLELKTIKKIYTEPNVNIQALRNDDKSIYSINNQSNDSIIEGFVIIDVREDNQLNAILSIIRTIFVSIVLSSGAIFFSRDVDILILDPIESMIKKVRRISENPLEAAQIEEKEALALEQLLQSGNQVEIKRRKELDGYETATLEKLIIKIGALLALGFGEAGSEIIAQNMSHGGDVDPMIPGRKIIAIFGFCDIRNFTDATEVLQTGVMLFVNEIAEITHSTVDSFGGQSNKNIGDAFLLVWKFQEKDYFLNTKGQLELKDEERIKNYADLSVLAFLKIMGGITVSKKLIKYRKNQGLKQRLGGKYTVKMGFGLHVGWAIEGAIGSNYKIDASYLSPNVNMASRLEAATKQFGTGILISGDLQQILTEKCKKELRWIDRVTVKGSINPMDLYTVDVSLDNVEKRVGHIDKFDVVYSNPMQKKKVRVLERIQRNKLKEEIQKGIAFPADKFQNDHQLIAMREFFNDEFYSEWNIGFQAYLKGKWDLAKNSFSKTLNMLEQYGVKDGPSNTLLDVIKENNGRAPDDWKGFRILTEK